MSIPSTSLILLASLLIAAHYSYALPSDQQQPIEIFSNNAQHDNKSGQSSYMGDVIVTQGSIKVEADTVTIQRETAIVEATGAPARFQQQPEIDQPPINAHANTIYYARDKGLVELNGNASIEQGDTLITGQRIVYNVELQTLDASSPSADKSQPPQRVRVVIPPQATTENTTP